MSEFFLCAANMYGYVRYVCQGNRLMYTFCTPLFPQLPETMPAMDVSKLERTMSTRFFIDFSSVESQHNQV